MNKYVVKGEVSFKTYPKICKEVLAALLRDCIDKKVPPEKFFDIVFFSVDFAASIASTAILTSRPDKRENLIKIVEQRFKDSLTQHIVMFGKAKEFLDNLQKKDGDDLPHP